MTNKLIKFLRRKDFELLEELGQGACGKTVLLNDPVINECFVCKKYSPIYKEHREELFENFVREIKLLHILNHQNIVRVFNYYLYPDEKTGYILMEHVSGSDIEDYLKSHPENINSVFVQVIEAFYYLEQNGILHRDIRPLNILVSEKDEVKVIDFGFGKKTIDPKDYDKSISLNWWCEPPLEFSGHIYNHSTEVYFVGKLFEGIILDSVIEQFAYKGILSNMCQRDPESRVDSFLRIRNEILSGAFVDIEFENLELYSYRKFAEQLTAVISKIERSTKYIESPSQILKKLEEAYKLVMLEEQVPSNALILKSLLSGSYYYSTSTFFEVSVIRGFLELLKSCSVAKRNIIIANLHTRMNAIERYSETPEFDDDIPF